MTIRPGDAVFIRSGVPAVVRERNQSTGELKLDQDYAHVQKDFRHGYQNGLDPDARSELYKILDVRDAKDYLGHIGLGAKTNVPNMGATNIPWKQFFDDGLRPNPAIEDKLHSVGITEDCRVIVLDADGVASAAVTMALRSFGYDDAGNSSGGLQDLLSR